MNLGAIRNQFDEERRTHSSNDVMIEVLPSVTRMRGTAGDWHTVIFSSLSGDNADAVIAEEVAHYRALRVEFEWKVYSHDQPADLLDRLKREGFQIGEREVVLVLDLEHPPAWVDEPPVVRTIRVRTPDDVETYRRITDQVFTQGTDRFASELAKHIQAGSTQHLGHIAFDGDTPASTGRLYTHPRSAFGGLYGGGTIAAHRGRGMYRALVAARARDARELGARYLIVDALPTSRPILERLGFVPLSETWPCTMQPL
jgi:predicted N-acetyltransferase YhbS